MASRTKKMQVYPWTGGLVTSLDEGLLQPGQLTVANNLVFDTQWNKKKRKGINHDYDNANFVVATRSSSGTSRTITGAFANTLLTTSDTISISGSSSASYNGTNMAITAISATDITYTAIGSLTESSAADTGIIWANNILAGVDFWFETAGSKVQYKVLVYDNGMIAYDSGGTRTRITDAGTAYTLPLTSASLEIYNNKVFIAVSGAGNLLKSWSGPGTVTDVAGAPVPSFLRTHLERLWCNDKTNNDRIHYCETGDHTKWLGIGDSGALDIGLGDGDPSGLSGMTPTFKGNTFIGKRNRLFRIHGTDPENFSVEKISDGIGFLSHNAMAAVDQDDIYFVSQRGIHSLVATDTYGAFSSSFISSDIQTSFSEDWVESRKPYIQAAYVPEINSVAFAVTDGTDTTNNTIWLYNVVLKAWYKWPDISCQALFPVQDSDKRRIYLGTSYGRLSQTLTTANYDTSVVGVSSAILFDVATGLIFPEGDLSSTKGFKRLGIIYRPEGSATITAAVKIDNFSSQSIAFTETGSTELLGTTFILGASILGSGVVMAPYAQTIDGYGRGVKVSMAQSGIEESANIVGFYLEYQPMGLQQEVRLGDVS